MCICIRCSIQSPNKFVRCHQQIQHHFLLVAQYPVSYRHLMRIVSAALESGDGLVLRVLQLLIFHLPNPFRLGQLRLPIRFYLCVFVVFQASFGRNRNKECERYRERGSEKNSVEKSINGIELKIFAI